MHQAKLDAVPPSTFTSPPADVACVRQPFRIDDCGAGASKLLFPTQPRTIHCTTELALSVDLRTDLFPNHYRCLLGSGGVPVQADDAVDDG